MERLGDKLTSGVARLGDKIVGGVQYVGDKVVQGEHALTSALQSGSADMMRYGKAAMGVGGALALEAPELAAPIAAGGAALTAVGQTFK